MSVLGKKWIIKNQSQNKDTFTKILENREHKGIADLKEYYDPFMFKDMKRAVERIDRAINDSEKILIFGDYDVDGISGTAILVQILRMLNADVRYQLPNREQDGYGLSKKFISDFIGENIDLLITVDCGISSRDEIAQAKKGGIETIITDHHTVPEKFPEDAICILHPLKSDCGYPYKHLTGSGVAFKFAHALVKNYFPEEEEKLVRQLADLASLGTVADLGPLTGENRLIVKNGLMQLRETKWIGLRKIIELSNIALDADIDTYSIGYQIAPRINAAGRIGDPHTALDLLLQESYTDELSKLGSQLEKLNSERQTMMFEAIDDAEEHFEKYEQLPYILITESPDWHVGVIGLIAGRVCEKYARPTIIMQDLGDTLTGSARSIPAFDIIEALTKHKDLFINFGGHAQAAGFNIKKKNLNKLKKALEDYAKNKLSSKDLRPTLELDTELQPEEITRDFMTQLQTLRPFGVANRKPAFVIKNVKPLFVDEVGRDRNHLKFSIELPKHNINVIGFNMGAYSNILRENTIDLACHLENNFWNNKNYLQLRAIDFKIND